MHARLQLRLLGTFGARLDGVPLQRLRCAEVHALLAYLGVGEVRVHLRQGLATLLFDDCQGGLGSVGQVALELSVGEVADVPVPGM